MKFDCTKETGFYEYGNTRTVLWMTKIMAAFWIMLEQSMFKAPKIQHYMSDGRVQSPQSG